MKIPRHKSLLAAALAATIALAASAIFASRKPQAPGQGGTPTIRSTVELVVVPVTVKDARGQVVGDLRRDEFRVLEDGVEQRISLFSADPFPLSAVVIFDGDLKTRVAERVQKSLIAMGGGFSDSDEVALGRFDAFYTPVLDFTTDHDQLLTELKRMDLKVAYAQSSQPIVPGPTMGGRDVPGAPSVAQTNVRTGKSTKHIDDAVWAAAQLLRTRDSQRRKMIILLSDGTDTRYNIHSYDETLRLLLSSNISVYAIGIDSAVILRGTTVLSRYAHATGGDVYYAAGQSDLARLYAQATEQSRHQYTLGYLPQETDRAKVYHSIEVRIRRPGLTLLTRDGYYSVPGR